MTPSQLYQLLVAGKALPVLSLRSARALLDLCRSALLAKGRKLTAAPTDADGVKTALMDAHKELVGGPQVYAQTGDITAMALDFDDIAARVKRLTAAGDPSPYLTALVESQQSKPTPARPAAPTAAARPSPRPAPVAARPAAPAPRPAQPAKPLPPPTSISSGAYDADALARRAAAQIAKRPKPAAAPAPAPRPMKNLELGHIRAIASRPGFKPADKAQALAEMALRGWTRTDSCWTKSGKA